ncbi:MULTISPECIES: alpha-L-glutamate ligase-like protein [unclassified Motilimonas]|uniref:alpha-L-glutamate ligase-like protein n=1 Tax=Motilimonas TaxID=1914248 RepID=UPI001E357582|nr:MULTISPECIES: alpha-L-glutamate ligase-like protein [unclassified Motilimonas]MCE0556091.1 alpha-L-glutamate ligase-like protein [Motilimonas sp. E26]MDO6527618.1 alpha-L-glutamate ligase-like protein [Motilimonas sp. 1_MG-2023]
MFGLLASPFKLKAKGIMGMNKRNGHYIGRYNKRSLYPLVDNKLKTKIIAEDAKVTVPALIGVISSQAEVGKVAELIKGRSGFVIKPAKGSGGKGILVITKVEHDRYYKPNGAEETHEDFERHVSNILAGLFSLGGAQDVAVIEALIEFDTAFDGFSYEGVPDVRVIVFKGFPVMAMMRLSTTDSDGKANLHQGAVGVGIDIGSGKALHAVQFGDPVTHHPDTNRALNELVVPQWDVLIRLAASCYEMSGLGYLGTDMVLDRDKGPMLLELNARPGLAIQVANGAGLLPRLQLVESLGNKKMTPEQRVEFAIKHFSQTPTI